MEVWWSFTGFDWKWFGLRRGRYAKPRSDARNASYSTRWSLRSLTKAGSPTSNQHCRLRVNVWETQWFLYKDRYDVIFTYIYTYVTYISWVSFRAQLKSEMTGTAHHAILACMKRQEATIEAWCEFSAPCRLRHGCLYCTRLITSIEINDMHYKLQGKDVKARLAIFWG